MNVHGVIRAGDLPGGATGAGGAGRAARDGPARMRRSSAVCLGQQDRLELLQQQRRVLEQVDRACDDEEVEEELQSTTPSGG